MRSLSGILLLLAVHGLAGCTRSTPSSPSPVSGGLFIQGTVSDTAFRPLAGARVEVLDGPQAGLSTTANAQGEFSLTGTFDDGTRSARPGTVT